MLLLGHLAGPTGETETAERVIRRAGGDRVRLAAALLDRRDRLLEARPEPDVEACRHEPHVGTHDPRKQDVADAVVDDVGPVDPVLADDDAAEPEPRRDRCDLAGVIRLDAADRDQGVAALRKGLGNEVLELPHLVAAVGESRVAVLTLGPDLDRPAQMLAQPFEAVHRRGPEEQRHALEVDEPHLAGDRNPELSRR